MRQDLNVPDRLILAWVLVMTRKKSQTVDLHVVRRGQFVRINSVVVSHYLKWDRVIWLAFIISEHPISILSSDLVGEFSSTLVSRKYPEKKMIVLSFEAVKLLISGFSAALIGISMPQFPTSKGKKAVFLCPTALSINMLKTTKHSNAMVREAV